MSFRLFSLTRCLLSMLATLVFLVGCGNDDMIAPERDATSGSGSNSESGPTFLQAPLVPPSGGTSLSGDGRDSEDYPDRTSSWIDGEVGGIVSVGRYTVVIPPGAFSGREKIEVRDRSEEFLECELRPHGLQFAVPVKLIVDVAGAEGEAHSLTMYWFDDADTDWVDVHGRYSSDERVVVTHLDHFSRYRPGRAGW